MTDPGLPGMRPPAPPIPPAAPQPGHMPPPPPGPMMTMQPQMQQPYRMSRPRTGMWRTFGLIMFVGVIGFNLLVFMVMIGGAGILGGGQQDPHGVAEFPREGGAGGKIAVIGVEGVIMEGGGGLFGGGVDPVALVTDGLNRAAADDEVRAVIIEVNSPGGGVTASDHIHHAIVKFKERTGKPVVIYMKDLAASGGYYISAPADHIVANHTTLTGSIGVIIQGFNFHGTLTEVVKGEDATIKAGGNKSMGGMFTDPDSQEYAEGRALLQELVDEMHVHFKKIVKDGRGEKLSADWETYCDGRVFSATTALKVGMIDEIGYFENAKAQAESLAGATDLAVVDYGRQVGLAALFGMTADRSQPKLEEAMSEQLRAQLQEQLRLYPGRPMAIWVP